MDWIAFILFWVCFFWARHWRKKYKGLEKELVALKDEKGKISNAVREKGIEVDTLTREVKRLKDESDYERL